MRLKKIQVSGFKSFVDPTTIKVTANVIGIVGPNGCGKSNVIDAVRWVMGESSAKNLRGDSMMDVIFNGSAARKPVSKASVELIFDTSGDLLPEIYAKFSELSIRRTLARDGQSDYYINNTRCRRRDIMDIFRGTGLGPRSYSIIEQGMVSRIIEAKPEDLRFFVEEAAGISKYKDRRRETETRIRHTRENLSRVEDIRSELGTQLRRLQRQSQAARRYKTLKQEERLVHAQLLCLRWQSLHQQLATHETVLQTLQSSLDEKLAEQKSIDVEIEDVRTQQSNGQESLNRIQAQYYRAGADISALEQRLQHQRETREKRVLELDRLRKDLTETESQHHEDEKRLQVLQQAHIDLTPTLNEKDSILDNAIAELQEVEGSLQQWQITWDQFGRESAEPVTQQGIHRAQIQQLETHIEQLNARQHRLTIEQEQVDSDLRQLSNASTREDVENIDHRYQVQTEATQALEGDIKSLRQQLDGSKHKLDKMRARYASAETRNQALKEVQTAALGEDDENQIEWLKESNLQKASRLTSQMRVEAGWEAAVDSVLSQKLAALCVDDLATLDAQMSENPSKTMMFLQLGRERVFPQSEDSLMAKVQCQNLDLGALLAGVRIATDKAWALSNRHRLSEHECFVSRDGVMVGANWMILPGEQGAGSGLLIREEEMHQLTEELASLEVNIHDSQDKYVVATKDLMRLEEDRDHQQNALATLTQQRTELHNRLGSEESQVAQFSQRLQQLKQELAEIDQQRLADNQKIASASQLLAAATQQSGTVEERRDRLLRDRDQLRDVLNKTREAVEQAREERHDVALKIERLQTEITSVETALNRLKTQIDQFHQRNQALQREISEIDLPNDASNDELQKLRDQRTAVESQLAQSRDQLTQLEEGLKLHTQRRADSELSATKARESLEAERLARQELRVRQQTLDEQLQEEGHDITQLTMDLPEQAEEKAWAEKSEQLADKINRIGPVNLVAIEEFEEQSERKEYLDKQHEDLCDALATLESVIRKIDKETRERFRETFDKLNAGFQELFPRLFGGGSAILDLTDEDLLNAGITVMARPPGKRNSTIHLLSGGEKAITAVALLFSFFQLNPAPFCLLDEVDAPLDDANVERYCQSLKSLAEHTQLMFITHNKITMETADVLLGVTMGEPGVSRLVSVNVDQATEFAGMTA